MFNTFLPVLSLLVLFLLSSQEFLKLQKLLAFGPVTSLADAALNATVAAAAKSSPEKLTAKDMKVLLDTLSSIET